jgi:hypothetical protein
LILLIFVGLNTLSPAQVAAQGILVPTVEFSSYLGGTGGDMGGAMVIDAAGNIYLTGRTDSPNFPASNPFNISSPSIYPGNIFVTRFDPTGQTILYSIFLGKGVGHDIAIDNSGNAYAVGWAWSLAIVNGIQTTNPGGEDAFIAKLNPSGTLVYSTYLGGSGYDVAWGLGLDSAHNMVIAGVTDSTNFPTHNPFQASNGGGQYDAFVAKLNAAGTALLYSTYLGGSERDEAKGVAVDSAGNAYITGGTASINFPSINAYQSEHAVGCVHLSSAPDCADGFVAKISDSGIPLYSTYLGGNGSYDTGAAIAVSPTGSAYVTGLTDSSNFPTVNPYQGTPPNPFSIFISRYSSDGSELMYSTYFGGTNDDNLSSGIALDAEGNIYLAGETWATDFPIADPVQAAKAPNPPGDTNTYGDAFASKFSADGQALLFSTYWGGSADEDAYPIGMGRIELALNLQGSIYLTGATTSSNFPTVNAFQNTLGSPWQNDAFFAKIVVSPISLPNAVPIRNYFTTHTPTLTWTPVSWALRYHVQASGSPSFTVLPYAFEGNVEGNYPFIVTGSLPNDFYYWRVQAQKPDGTWSAWTAPDSFTIFVDE